MLTERQRELMLTIQRTIAKTGEAPTLDELCASLKLSSRGHARALLHRLVGRGYITCERGITRSIRVVKPIPEEKCQFYVFDNEQKALVPFEPQPAEAAE